jgi:hypothetical protein
MRHLKRFKNWIVVIYYACSQYAQQQLETARARNNQSESNEAQPPALTANDSLIVEAAEELITAKNSTTEVVETIEKPVAEPAMVIPPTVEVKKPLAAGPKVTSTPQAPLKANPTPAQPVKVQAPPVKANLAPAQQFYVQPTQV